MDIDPQYPEAYFLLANAQCDLDQSQKALGNYKKAIKLKADYADAWGNMADIYVDRNDFEKALISYEPPLIWIPTALIDGIVWVVQEGKITN